MLGLAAAAGVLAGCGTGFNAQTQQWYDPADGAGSPPSSSQNGMAVRDLVVVSDGTDAAVLATVVNTGSQVDEVVQIVVEGSPATIDGSLEAVPSSVVRVGEPADTSAVASGSSLVPGSLAQVEFQFGSAPAQTLEAVVRAPVNYYEDALP